MGLRIVCQIVAEESKLSFTWGEGAASFFDPYSISGFALEKIRRTAVETRKRLANLVDLYTSPVGVLTTVGPELFELAQLGHDIYREIFRPPESHVVERWLREYTDLQEIESLEIVLHADSERGLINLDVPWNVVYGQSPTEGRFEPAGDGEGPNLFWGRLYNLACSLRVDPLRRRHRLEQPVVLFVVDTDTEARMARQSPAAGIKLTSFITSRRIVVVRNRQHFEQTLRSLRPDIVYWFSHATPGELYLAADKLSAFDLFQIFDTREEGRRGGFVFLNACRTAQWVAGNRAYLSAITQCGMSGLIGTEEETLDIYANDLGLTFLEEFLKGNDSVAEIMRSIRRAHPLGLLYSTYCPPHIRASKPVVATPVLPPAPEGLEVSQRLGPEAVPISRPLPPETPYMALAAYGKRQRALFAGRRRDCDRFAAVLNLPSTRIMILQGASGVGKTSFLRAEVIPFLEEESIGYRFMSGRGVEATRDVASDSADESGLLFVRAGKDLIAELGDRICDFAAQPYRASRPDGEPLHIDLAQTVRSSARLSDVELTPIALIGQLRSGPEVLQRILAALATVLPFGMVLIVDQAEEIFTQGQGPEVWAALRAVAASASGDFKLILSLRTEYYGRFVSALRPSRSSQGENSLREYLLTDFSEDDLVEAILRPTLDHPLPYTSDIPRQVYKFRYEDDLARTIAQQVREYAAKSQDSILPLVQVICVQLYERVNSRQDPNRAIVEDDLTAIDGVSGGMSRHVDALIATLFQDEKDQLALKETLARLVLEQADGTYTTAIVEEPILAKQWRGKTPFADVLHKAAQPEYRLLKRGQLRDNVERLEYVSLGHDALAKVAQVWMQEQQQKRRRKLEVLVALVSLGLLGLFAILWLRASSARLALQKETAEREKIVAVQAQDTRAHLVETASYAAQAVAAENPALGITLAAAANRWMDTEQTRGHLIGALEQQPHLVTLLPGHVSGVCQIAFGKDPSVLAALECGGTIHVWDLTVRRERKVPIHLQPGDQVIGLAVLSGDVRLAVALRSGLLRVLESGRGGKSRDCTFAPPLPGVDKSDLFSNGERRDVAFSADGHFMAYSNGSDIVTLWGVPDCEKAQPLKLVSNVRELALSPDGTILGVGGDNGAVWALHTDTHKTFLRLPALPGAFKDPDYVDSVGLAPDGKSLAAAYFSGRVQLVSVGKSIQQTRAQYSVAEGLTLAQSGRLVAFGTRWDGDIQLWRPGLNGNSKILVAHTRHLNVLRASPDGERFASGSEDSFVALWSIDAECRICAEPFAPRRVSGAAFLPDGDLIVQTYASPTARTLLLEKPKDQKLEVWSGGKLEPLHADDGGTGQISVSSDGNRFAEVHVDNTIKVFDRSGRELPAIQPGGDFPPHYIAALSSDGGLIAVGGDFGDSHVKIWRVGAAKVPPVELEKNFDGVVYLAFARGNKTLVVVEGRTGVVSWWDVATGTKSRPEFDKTPRGVFSTNGILSSDGWTYAEGEDNQIRVWNLHNKTQLGAPLTHKGSSFVFAFSHDGRLLASGSESGTIRLWSIPSLQPFGTVLSPGKRPTQLEFSPDDHVLLSVTEDDSALLWTLDGPGLSAIAERVVNRNLSPAEWRRFFGSEAYVKAFSDLPVPDEGQP